MIRLMRRFLRALLSFLFFSAIMVRSAVAVEGTCERWTLVWFTEQWYEETYVHEQLLQPSGFTIDKIVVHKLRPKIEKKASYRNEDFRKKVEENIDEALKQISDCSIIVVRLRQFPGCASTTKIAKKYRKSGVRHWYVLVGEENELSCETCSEFYDVAPFVVRHYHDSTCEDRRDVMTIPMGTIKPLDPNVTVDSLSSSREYVWSFASGHVNGARDQIVAWLRSSENAQSVSHRLIYPGRDPDYIRTLSKTAIALCPRGNHEETWRLYESIASGCIPVVTSRTYWSKYMPNDVVREFFAASCQRVGRRRETCDRSSFDRAMQEAISLYRSNPDELNARQVRLQKAYARYNDAIRKEMKARVQALVSSSIPHHDGDL